MENGKVIVHLSGGFGNQLFSYAFGYALSKKRSQPLWIDTAIQDEDWFFRNPDILSMNITYDRRLSYPIKKDLPSRALLNKIRFRSAIGFQTKEIKEDKLAGSPVEVLQYCVKYPASSIYARGNWQREAFFEEFSNDIKSRFKFNTEKPFEFAALEDELRKNPASVGIHYRRGDYVRIGVSPSPEYFLKAMELLSNVLSNPVFYVFSEDLNWVKDQFKSLPYDIRYPDAKPSDGNKGILDFRLLSACSHQIISNSSYSWWAAWLNENPEKKIIFPYIEGHSLWDKDFGASGWISIPFTTLPKT
ncbi:MAG: alpha-1,2-fucosyltransferase [Lachnospiraceae bacterium]|nr:alpha-1,2-fucosyltransferase [Lachnospiraceae bacterium]